MIHTFSLDNFNFVVDGNSASIYALDDVSYDILKDRQALPSLGETMQELAGRYDESDIAEAHREIKCLADEESLFAPDILSECKVNSPGIKAVCLNVSHDCNLMCEYCFAGKGDYNTQRRTRMSGETAIKAIDFLIERSNGRRDLEIDFFGGEPLMNFGVVKDTVAYCQEIERRTGRHFHYTVTTNATLLNNGIIDYINEHMDNVVISLDGRKEVHDALRYDRCGCGSYDRIVPLARRLVAQRKEKSYYIRGTFTSRNKDFSNDVFHLADLGFKEISVEPVVGSGGGLHIKPEDVPEILDEYERLARLYLVRLSEGRDFQFYHFKLNLYNGPCLPKRIAACGAGFEYIAVSPEGDLYPCHQFVGQREFVLGSVQEGITNKKTINNFMNNNIVTKEACANCWAKLFCSGGCHANAWFSNGDIAKPNSIGCALQKKRIECAIMVRHAIQKNCNVPATVESERDRNGML